MKKTIFLLLMIIAIRGNAQERYLGLTRDSIIHFHAAYFEQVLSNDTALVVRIKRNGQDWRYFRFDKAGICIHSAYEIAFYNEFTDMEKKLKAKKYKKTDADYDFGVRKVKGELFSNGKDNYLLTYDPINPNLINTTRAVIYYKTSK